MGLRSTNDEAESPDARRTAYVGSLVDRAINAAWKRHGAARNTYRGRLNPADLSTSSRGSHTSRIM